MIDDNGVAVVAGFDNNGRGGGGDCFSHHRTNRSKLGFSKKCDTVPFSRLYFENLKFVRPVYRRPPKARKNNILPWIWWNRGDTLVAREEGKKKSILRRLFLEQRWYFLSRS